MEVTNDLRALSEMEIPPKDNPLGRNIVKMTIFCFSILLLSSFGVVTYALVASLDREGDARESLNCVRASTVDYDEALGDAVKLLVDLDVPITKALVAVGRGDDAALEQALAETDRTVADAGPVKAHIDDAIKARRVALQEC